MQTIRESLNRSRQELLDLSTRNRLLSVPVQSKSARIIQVHDELSEQVFRLLVEEKKTLSFLPGRASAGTAANEADEEIGLPQPEEGAMDADSGLAKRHVDSRLQTALSPEGLQRRLLALCRDAQTMIEEQGVNILYLAFGQLKWFEADKTDTPRYAPLVLVPVELHRDSAADRFHMHWREEDIEENLSLAAKLKTDFGIELPPFPSEDDFSVEAYCAAVTRVVAGAKNWEVLPNSIVLGFFSFSKFLMYRDLDPDNWPDGDKFLKHPSLTALLQDGFPQSEPLLSDDVQLDELIPATRLDHVVDSDSSQTLALELVRQGRSLVIQGPPGTGKSQSITNIIAAAVLDGKRVLFVAEKLAALEVVKRRLEREGLGPLCLELHSNKANKRAVIEEIGRTWRLGRPTTVRLDAVVVQLEQVRGTLNKHVALLHEHVMPSGLSPYAVIGRLVALGERGCVTGNLSFSGAENWTGDDREERRRLVAELATRVAEIGVPAQHPWRGVRREMVLRIDLDPLAARIRSLASRLAELQATVPDLAGVIKREIPSTFAEIEEQRTFAQSATIILPNQKPWCGVGKGAIAKDNLISLATRIRSRMARLAELQQTAPGLAAILQRSAPTTFSEIEEQKFIAERTTIDLSSEGVWRGVGLTSLLKNGLDQRAARIRLLVSRLVEVRETSVALAAAMQEKPPASFSDIQTQQAIANAPTMDLSSRHAWRGVGNTTVKKSDLDSLAARIRPLTLRLSEMQETSGKLAAAIHQRIPRTFSEADERQIIAGFVAEAPPLDKQAFTSEAWDEHFDALRNAVTNGRRYTATVGAIGLQVTEAAWGEDFTDVRAQLAAHGHSWLRILKGDYRRALIRLRCVMRTKLPKGLVERLALVDQLIAGQSALRALHAAETRAKAAFGTVWRQEQTDWARAERIIDWVSRLREVGLEMSFRRMFVLVENQTEVGRLVEELASRLAPTRSNASQLVQELGVDCTSAFGVAALDGVPLESLAERLQTWVNDLQSLSEWSKKVAQQVEQLAPRFIAARGGAGQLCQEYKLNPREAFGNPDLDTVPLDVLVERCYEWLAELGSLFEWSKGVARLAELLVPHFVSTRNEARQLCKELRLECREAFGTAALEDVRLGAIAERCQSWLVELESLSEWSNKVAQVAEQLTPRFVAAQDEAKQLCHELSLDCGEAFDVAGMEHVPLVTFADRCQVWLAELESLSKWSNYYTPMRRARELALNPLVEQLQNGTLVPGNAVDCFERVCYEQMLRWFIQRHPELARFDGLRHEAKIAEFRQLDRDRLLLAKVHTLLAHSNHMPSSNSGVGATGLVKSEMERKRGHRTVRRLLKDAGSVVQAIKPVFMMSPLSVAQYLGPGTVEFDLLVVDEASQVQPVDALGAIVRCKQIVVVGDSKQLPPTRFFARLTTESTGDEDMEMEAQAAEAKDIESILGLCCARGLPQTMLRWHYRSRHHSLIAVSNHEFYEDRLFIIPSPYSAAAGLGLKFNHVPDGVFDSGGSGTNRVEAKAVCRAVIEHARRTPQLSLGVAAFSVRQQQAILDELELLRRENPETEPFFNDHSAEPFFVKNLENVQGDERDVIYISVGYGRDVHGFMAMRFGPLSNEGGERRLNVLISRAKKRCEVFSSITADDIDLERASGRGVHALKTFLSFAQTGRLAVASASGREEESPFEEAVRKAVESLGYEVHAQVGIAGFFIDLAVVDRERQGRYLLGIECDGATYHSSRSARDRDRLRQAVLEDHGWIIHRIWSTDWFQRPAEQLRKVVEAIERAKVVLTEMDHHEEAPTVSLKVTAVTDDGIERETVLALDNNGISALATPYKIAHPAVPRSRDPHELSAREMADLLLRVVEEESPIHEDEIVARIRDLWELQRAGSRIQDAVASGVRSLLVTRRCVREDGFLSMPGVPVPVRNRENADSPSLRKPDMLPPAEIRAAVLALIDAHHGATASEIPIAVARMLGFKTTSGPLRTVIEAQIRRLLRLNTIQESDGMLRRSVKA